MGILDFFKKAPKSSEQNKGSESIVISQLSAEKTQAMAVRVDEIESVESLISKLKNVDSHVRQNAAEALGKHGDSRAIEPLITVLHDGVDQVRRSALESLRIIGEPAVMSLITALNDNRISATAAEALGQIGDSRAIEPLLSLLRKESSHKIYDDYDKVSDLYIRPINVAEYICVALRKMDKLVLAVEPLIATLKDLKGNNEVYESVLKQLKKIGKPAVVPLISELNDIDCPVRAQVAAALGEIGQTEGVGPLIEALQDENTGVRSNSANALGKIGDIRAIEPLVEAMKDENSFVRKSVGEALTKLGWQPSTPMEKIYYFLSLQKWQELAKIRELAVGLLSSALKDIDYRVRENAAKALGTIGDTRAVEPLIEALNDKNRSMSAVAAETLGQIGDTRAVEPLIQALKDGCLQAVKALGKIGDTRAVEPLIVALREKEYFIRLWAATSLGEIGDARAAQPLIETLNDKDSRVQESVALSLMRIGEPAVEPLIAALKAAQHYTIENTRIGDVLRKIDDTRAVPRLIAALKDTDSRVRECAAEALGVIGDSRAIEPLDDTTSDYDSVKEKAEAALRKIRSRQTK